MKETSLDVRVENALVADEKIVWYGKPDVAGFVKKNVVRILPVVVLWLILDGAFIATMIATDLFDKAPYLSFLLLPFFIIHLAPMWIWLSGVMQATENCRDLTYALTDKRLIIAIGKNNFDLRSVLLAEVSETELIRTISDKLAGTGDLNLTGERVCVRLFNLKNCEKCLEIFNAAIAGADSRESSVCAAENRNIIETENKQGGERENADSAEISAAEAKGE